MKQVWTDWITPQPCHIHFCRWLLPIWPMLYVCAENRVYGLWWLGWWYTGAKLSFIWSYIVVSLVWNTSELSELHLSHATAISVVDCCQFGPSLMFGLKMELMACADLVGGTTEQNCIFPDLKWQDKWYETIWTCLHHTSAVPRSFLLLIAANSSLTGF